MVAAVIVIVITEVFRFDTVKLGVNTVKLAFIPLI